MHIIFNPPVNEENKYIEIMVRPLRKEGFIIHALDDFISSRKHFQSIRLVHLNWFENVDDNSFRSAFRSFARKMFVLSIIRMNGKKLVWTMHNRVSHEKKTGRFSRIITKYLVRWSDRIIIHSEMSREIVASRYPEAVNKLIYLPHPDFIDIYGSVPSQKHDSLPLRLLFVGAVKPYKNIELLIRAAKQYKGEVNLTIAGKPSSQAYGRVIEEMASSAGNVELKLEFIPDHVLPELMQQCDLLVLPYDLNSSLNSGTVILAFSYKKTVICPEIGTIEDLDKAKEKVLHYNYQSEEEHLHQLKLQIATALDMKRENPQIFHLLGRQLFEHVKEVHNKNLIGKKLAFLYRDILR